MAKCKHCGSDYSAGVYCAAKDGLSFCKPGLSDQAHETVQRLKAEDITNFLADMKANDRSFSDMAPLASRDPGPERDALERARDIVGEWLRADLRGEVSLAGREMLERLIAAAMKEKKL